MGRSRGNNFNSIDEDVSHRSRRKQNAATRKEAAESSATGFNLAIGQDSSKRKRGFYHCNYCNKDITGMIRIKCAVCPDFDLCVECFFVGAEVKPHERNHPYRVMEKLSFPLLCSDWNAEEEMLLLEGLDSYGFGNWAEVAEHVGTKSKEACIEHYTNLYLNSPNFPLPDMSHVAGKDKHVLLAMAEEHDYASSPFKPSYADVLHQIRIAEKQKSSTNVQVEPNRNSDSQTDRNSKKKKLISSRNEEPDLIALSGFNPQRREFDPEYDNDAERLLADMEFKDSDSAEERELKLRVLHIYSRRLDERQRRKDFILERNLLHPNPFEKHLSPEEKAFCRQYDIFMRFHSKEEHEDLLQTVINEQRTIERIQELHKAKAAGCRTFAEADSYLELRRKTAAGESSIRAESNRRKHGGRNVSMASGSINCGCTSRSHTKPARQSTASQVHYLLSASFEETKLLSEAENHLCWELRLPPPVYLKMQEVLVKAIFSGQVSKRSDAHAIFNIEVSKVDRVYDVLVRKGIAPP